MSTNHPQTLADVRRALVALPPFRAECAPWWAGEVTVVATTYERPWCVLALMRSIRLHTPWLRVLVSDTGREPLFPCGTQVDSGLRWLAPDADAGHNVSVSRNFLLDRVETPFLFLADDDHTFTSGTDLARMHSFLVRSGFDLVAGAQGRRGYGAAVFERRGFVLVERFNRHHGVVEPGVVRCDRVENSFLARTDAVRAVRWDARLVGREHDEFFVRAAAGGLTVAQMGGTWVAHARSCETATGVAAGLLGRVLPIHVDREYRRHQVGARRARRRRSLEVRSAERACLAELGVTAIRRRRARLRRWLLRRQLAGTGSPRRALERDDPDGS